MEYITDNEVTRQELYRMIDSGKVYRFEVIENKYTKKQRGSLHVWCEMCAKTLNEAGIYCERKAVFGGKMIEIPWTKMLFKESVYIPILNAMTGLESTEDQSTVTPSEVAMVISKQYAENGLVCPPWPSHR